MKFIQPLEITAEYKITTPMFLGGAAQDRVDAEQFRNASLKGALRFWWRALNWGPMLKACNGHEEDALKALHEREGKLFGKACDANNSGQSMVLLSSTLEGCRTHEAQTISKDYAYLLGLGLYLKGGLRPYLSGGTLTITARCKCYLSVDDLQSLRQAMVALGIFGALGSRARKGFGSIAIHWLKENNQLVSRYDTSDAIEKFIRAVDFSAPDNAPLSAFTRSSRIDFSLVDPQQNVLKKISNEIHAYRDGTVKNREPEKNFSADRNLAKAAAEGKVIQKLPSRAAFGLPHNYQWKGTGLELQITPSESTRNRRASPLFIHVHELSGGESLVIQALLPCQFLPNNLSVELEPKRGRPILLKDPTVDYQVIHRYLDRFEKYQGYKKVFPHAQ